MHVVAIIAMKELSTSCCAWFAGLALHPSITEESDSTIRPGTDCLITGIRDPQVGLRPPGTARLARITFRIETRTLPGLPSA